VHAAAAAAAAAMGTAQIPHPPRIVTSFQSFIARLPSPRRHGPRVLWQAISEIERRAYFELALASVT